MAQLLSEAVRAFTDNGVPVAHGRFHDAPDPPYAETMLEDSNYGYADDRTLRLLCEYTFTLYTADRDLELENLIQDGLDEAGITYRKRGGFAPYDDLITTTYRIDVYER